MQITARSDSDLSPETIVQKVADASGAKYTAGGSAPLPTPAAPPVAKKPVFTPTTSASGTLFNPLVSARNRRSAHADDDGWGADAPQVTRTQLEKVAPAYKPTKVNISDLRKNHDESRAGGGTRQDDRLVDVVQGTYQPIGKVDIAAIRAQAKDAQDNRPITIKGAYEPVGKVDIAAIRARAQRPAEADQESERPKSLAERTAAFTHAERLAELPKPRVANKFGTSAFAGTKAPTPSALGFGTPPALPTVPVGAASRTFADQGGKTPAQLWAEKHQKQGAVALPAPSPPAASPVSVQKSGSEWKSGYGGKSWAPVQAPAYSRGGIELQTTGGTDRSELDLPASPVGGLSGLDEKFRDTTPASSAATRSAPSVPAFAGSEQAVPLPPVATRPTGGFALPGLPSRPAAEPEEHDHDQRQEDEITTQSRARDERERSPSPIEVAVPVARSDAPELEPPAERLVLRPVPVPQDLPKEEDIAAEEETYDPRAAATVVANHLVGHVGATNDIPADGKRAVIEYDYEKAEGNEIDLCEGEHVTNIEMVDEDWWMGTNSRGESGLFPSNYVRIVDDDRGAVQQAAPPSTNVETPTPAHPKLAPSGLETGSDQGHTATAEFDYEAAEDNGELSLFFCSSSPDNIGSLTGNCHYRTELSGGSQDHEA